MTAPAIATEVSQPIELPTYAGDNKRLVYVRALVWQWMQANRPDVIELARELALKKFPKRPARKGGRTPIELPAELKALK